MRIQFIASHAAIGFAAAFLGAIVGYGIGGVRLALLLGGLLGFGTGGIYIAREALGRHEWPWQFVAKLFQDGQDSAAQGLGALAGALLLLAIVAAGV